MPVTRLNPTTGQRELDPNYYNQSQISSGYDSIRSSDRATGSGTQSVGYTSPGSTDPTSGTGQHPSLDYLAGKLNYQQEFPSNDANSRGQLAPALQNNTQASNSNFQWQQNQLYGGLNNALSSLTSRGGNAYSQSQMNNMHAMALQQLQGANQQAMRGYAQANGARGVAGNSLGGILGNSLGVQNAGALAQGDLAELQSGLTLGNQQTQTLGGLVGAQDARNQQTQQTQFAHNADEQSNAYNDWRDAQKAYTDYWQQYIIPLTSSSGGSNGDQVKTIMRAHANDLARQAELLRQEYLKYGSLNNPSQGVNIQSTNTLGAAA